MHICSVSNMWQFLRDRVSQTVVFFTKIVLFSVIMDAITADKIGHVFIQNGEAFWSLVKITILLTFENPFLYSYLSWLTLDDARFTTLNKRIPTTTQALTSQNHSAAPPLILCRYSNDSFMASDGCIFRDDFLRL